MIGSAARVGVACLVIAACGARTPIDTNDRAPAPSLPDAAPADACGAPLCSDNTRGTWRLETNDGRPAGYLFTFDGRGRCGGTSQSFLLVLERAGATCSRNGDYDLSQNDAAGLVFSSDNMGGHVNPICGELRRETLGVALRRSACDPARYDVALQNSEPSSFFEVNLRAVRCRCDLPWLPCVSPLPDDPCAP